MSRAEHPKLHASLVRRSFWAAGSLCATLAIAGSRAQQPLDSPRVWQADLAVQVFELTAIKGGGPITARVVVATGNDEARGVRLEMLLPVGIGVLRVPDGCRPSPSPVASLNARVSCAIGDMPVRALREVSVTTTGVPAVDARPHFAVFVFSDTPDPRPTNNFAERSLGGSP
jgi:hypothetical protein